mmetsp:Transcript_15687/g.1404  ORF Transcript_15687/g.1404 Transcript_15687/m.1404 type:complete len:91 (-) Transcript_15687:124-396(-)
MIKISTLKCLITPVMIFNIILGSLAFIVFIMFIPFLAIILGGFYISAGVCGLVGMKPGKKCCFVVFVVEETILSIFSVISCIVVFGEPEL